jgi:hypothetical protein
MHRFTVAGEYFPVLKSTTAYCYDLHQFMEGEGKLTKFSLFVSS